MALVVVVAAALAAPAVAQRPHATPPIPAPLARVLDCTASGADRAAVFYGRMRAVPGTVRMAMRFTLVERLGLHGDWDRLEVPGLRSWRRSAPGVATFAYRQRVEDLRAGGMYRAQIQFRWYGRQGVLRTATRQTRTCRGPLPDLRVGELQVRPGPTDDTRVYRVAVVNAGGGAADDVPVRVMVDRAVIDAPRIAELAPGESRVVSVSGPACTRRIAVRVDPANVIGETSEADNLRSWDCSP